jgi:hypothetical protein
MSDWTARVVRIRTTHDGSGRACGIVTGMGATPVRALAELRREAQELAQQEGPAAQAAGPTRRARPGRVSQTATPTNTALVAKQIVRGQGGRSSGRAATTEELQGGWGGLEPASSEPQVLRFEVVDVRLTPGAMEGGGNGWLAYGTLLREGGS